MDTLPDLRKFLAIVNIATKFFVISGTVRARQECVRYEKVPESHACLICGIA